MATTGPAEQIRPRPATSPGGAGRNRSERARPPATAGRSPVVAALLLATLGVLYRVFLLAREVPPTNSDEATMGLAALHIATGRELPIFFYGQAYMGAFEAYVAAPLVAVFGPSVTVMRIPNLLLYAAFLLVMWELTRRLFDPWLAVFTVAVLALGSDRIIKNQLVAGGGYPEMNPAGALLLLLSFLLATGGVRRPAAAYAGWGLVAGLMLWIDWLVLPYVAAAGAVLLLFRRARLRGRAGLALGAGLVAGALPLIIYNVTGPRNSLSVFLSLSTGGAAASWPDKLFGGVLFGVPMGMGMCAPSRCAPWQLWWGVAFLALLGVAGAAALRGLRGGSEPARAAHAVRLGMVVAAVLTMLMYAKSPAAGNTPVESSRYLSCLLISLPAVLWPLWRVARAAPGGGPSWRARGPAAPGGPGAAGARWRLGAVAVLAATLLTAAVATVQLVGAVPAIAQDAAHRRQLVAALRELGVDRFYSDYWTCNNISFATEEEIVCAVLGDDLRPGLDRYRPYRAQVAAAPDPAYVVLTGSALGAAVAQRLAGVAGVRKVSVPGHDIYLPPGRVGIPR